MQGGPGWDTMLVMPLSDREQEILRDIEARLREEDPRLVKTVGRTTPVSLLRGRLKWAALGFLVGLVLLFFIVANIWWGFAGAAVMLASAVYGGGVLREMGSEATKSRGAAASGRTAPRLMPRRRDGDE